MSQPPVCAEVHAAAAELGLEVISATKYWVVAIGDASLITLCTGTSTTLWVADGDVVSSFAQWRPGAFATGTVVAGTGAYARKIRFHDDGSVVWKQVWLDAQGAEAATVEGAAEISDAAGFQSAAGPFQSEPNVVVAGDLRAASAALRHHFEEFGYPQVASYVAAIDGSLLADRAAIPSGGCFASRVARTRAVDETSAAGDEAKICRAAIRADVSTAAVGATAGLATLYYDLDEQSPRQAGWPDFGFWAGFACDVLKVMPVDHEGYDLILDACARPRGGSPCHLNDPGSCGWCVFERCQCLELCAQQGWPIGCDFQCPPCFSECQDDPCKDNPSCGCNNCDVCPQDDDCPDPPTCTDDLNCPPAHHCEGVESEKPYCSWFSAKTTP